MYIIAYIKDINLLPLGMPKPNLVRHYKKSNSYRVAWEIIDYQNNDKQKTNLYLQDIKFLLQLTSNGNIIGYLSRLDKKFNRVHDIKFRIAQFDIYTKTQKMRIKRANDRAGAVLNSVAATGNKENAVFNAARHFCVELARLRWHSEWSIQMIVKWAHAAVYGKNNPKKEYCERLSKRLLEFAELVHEQIKKKDRDRKRKAAAV
jgi:hypothetical protein